jgi:hypothetical protein
MILYVFSGGYTGYFTSHNEPGGIENTIHNTLERKPADNYPAFPPDVLWVAFSIPPGSLSLVKYPVFDWVSVVLPTAILPTAF